MQKDGFTHEKFTKWTTIKKMNSVLVNTCYKYFDYITKISILRGQKIRKANEEPSNFFKTTKQKK
jgi:hypothetical protein